MLILMHESEACQSRINRAIDKEIHILHVASRFQHAPIHSIWLLFQIEHCEDSYTNDYFTATLRRLDHSNYAMGIPEVLYEKEFCLYVFDITISLHFWRFHQLILGIKNERQIRHTGPTSILFGRLISCWDWNRLDDITSNDTLFDDDTARHWINNVFHYVYYLGYKLEVN